jgi:hypothetical protein
MTSKPDALHYLKHRLSTDKKFAVSMLAELIIKNCDPAKLSAAVEKWKVTTTTTTTTTPPKKPILKAPSNKPISKEPSTTPTKAPKEAGGVELRDDWGEMG